MADARISVEECEEERTAREHIEEIKKKLREVQEVDLAFLLDATGSMGTLIQAVKVKIVDIAQGVKKVFPDGKMRFACAFYRDYDADRDDNPYQRSGICCQFTDDVTVLQNELNGLKAWGGGDAPEDVFSGLQRLLDLKWTAPATRLVYHIADHPCHGRRFHDIEYAKAYKDTAFEQFKSKGATQEDDPEGRTIEDILMSLAKNAKISTYTFLHIHPSRGQRPTTAKMLEEFKKANDRISSRMKLDERTVKRPEHGKDLEAMETISAQVKETVTNSVKSGMTQHVNEPFKANNTTYEEIPVDDKKPSDIDWPTLTIHPVFFHPSQTYESVDAILTQIMQGTPLEYTLHTGEPIYVRIAEHPFTSACETRWPFYAKIQIGRHSSSDNTMLIVMKRFKSDDIRSPKDYVNSFQHPYLEVMETYTIASQFAQEFNNKMKKGLFLECAPKTLYWDMTLSTCKVAGDHGGQCFTIETLLSNPERIKVDEKSDYYETLQAFSHWTHVRSDKFLMVIVHTLVLENGADGKRPQAVLCDPSIHCTDYLYRFKRTNKGEVGIDDFYRNHTCNQFCKALDFE